MGGNPGLSGWAQHNHRGLYKKETEEEGQSQKNIWVEWREKKKRFALWNVGAYDTIYVNS